MVNSLYFLSGVFLFFVLGTICYGILVALIEEDVDNTGIVAAIFCFMAFAILFICMALLEPDFSNNVMPRIQEYLDWFIT